MEKRKSTASEEAGDAKRVHHDLPVLYSYFRSSSSWRVRIILGIKKIDYEYKAVNLLKGEQHSEEYVKLNPSHEIPALVIDGVLLAQSVSIMEYLEETRPEISVFPKSPALKAKVREIVQTICADTQPVQNLRVLNYVGEKKQEWAKHWITVNFEALEKILAKSAGKYCVGDELTMADACLVPQVYNANRFSVDMAKFPTIARLNATLVEEEIFKKASPEVQPDCPEDLKTK